MGQRVNRGGARRVLPVKASDTTYLTLGSRRDVETAELMTNSKPAPITRKAMNPATNDVVDVVSGYPE